MRFKYFYQQMLSHIVIITFAFIIVSLIVSQFAESLIFKNKEEELIAYGETIIEELEVLPSVNMNIFEKYQKVLASRNIYVTYFDEKGRIQYPEEDHNTTILFSKDEWDQLSAGKNVVVNGDFNRFDHAVSLVVLPHKVGNYFNGGIILTSPFSGIRNMLKEFNHYLFLTVLITLMISFIISWYLSIIHVRRIKQLQKATSAVACGDLNVSVPDSKFDEISELASDFNKMVERLKESKEEIERLEKRRRQFMADVSHEMRTPLTTISGIVEGLQNDMIPERQKEKGLSLISQETKRLIRLVNENLDYEKIRSNQIVLEKEEIEVADLFEIIEEQLQLEAQKKKNDIRIELENNPIVYADFDRLVQILLNITKNSIQFTENGTIVLRAKETEEFTIIEVEDNGIGIDAKDIENIWLRFYKADLSRKTNPFGEFGLGLSIVKQLVLMHQGKIEVESEKGVGTKFIIFLPPKQSEEGECSSR